MHGRTPGVSPLLVALSLLVSGSSALRAGPFGIGDVAEGVEDSRRRAGSAGQRESGGGGPFGGIRELVRNWRHSKRLGERLARIPTSDAAPDGPRWPRRFARKVAAALAADRRELRPHSGRSPVPGSLDLPFDSREGTPAPADPEISMPRGMTYQNWTLGMAAGMADLWIDVTFHSLPEGDDGIYLQVWDANIGETGQYMGFQYRRDEDGRIRTNSIWSRWGTRDTDHLEEAPGGYHESAGYEGDFISVRYPYEFGVGTYTVHVRLDEVTDRGVWYAKRIYDHQAGSWTETGRLRFPFSGGNLPLIRDGGGSWQEVFGGVDRPGEVGRFHLSIGGVYTLGRAVAAREVRTTYADQIDNTDISLDPATERVHVRYGGDTPRRTKAQTFPLGR